MSDMIRIDDLAKTPEEKELLLKALTDEAFRSELEQRVEGGDMELSDDDADMVVGGARSQFRMFSRPQLTSLLSTVRHVQDRMGQGGQLLCM